MWMIGAVLVAVLVPSCRNLVVTLSTWVSLAAVNHCADLAWSALLVGAVCALALAIDGSSVLAMFGVDSCWRKAGGTTKPGTQKEARAGSTTMSTTTTTTTGSGGRGSMPTFGPAPVFTAHGPASRGSTLLRGANWGASWALLYALVHLVAVTRHGGHLLDNKVTLLTVLATFTYLTGIFGSYLVRLQLDSLRASSSRGAAVPASASASSTSTPRVDARPSCSERMRWLMVQFVLGVCAVLSAASLVIAVSLRSSDIAVFVAAHEQLLGQLAAWCGDVGNTPTLPPSSLSSFVSTTLPYLLAAGLGVSCTALFLRPAASTGDGGSAVEPDCAAEAHARRVRRDRVRAATYPKPYPNGWLKLLNSNELRPGDVKYIHAAGQHLAVFRGRDDGAIGVLDAYCPHLGANLAVGGTVRGDALVCPFHKWSFRTDGVVNDIPYTDKVPSVAKAHAWPVVEYYGMILVYLDDERRAPPYFPPAIEELDQGLFPHRGDFRAKDVRMHIQEFAENSVDFAHFDPLHGKMMVPWTTYTIPGVTIDHTAKWVPGQETGDGKHIAYFHDHAELRVLGRRIPNSGADAVITFVGPAGLVFFRFKLPNLGHIIMFQTHLPLGPSLLRCEFRWFADPCIPRALVWYVVGNWVSQWGNDRQVWENKVFLPRALLVKGDGPVSRLRRWYQQFYASGQPKVNVRVEDDASVAEEQDPRTVKSGGKAATNTGAGAGAGAGSGVTAAGPNTQTACAHNMQW